MLAEDCRAVNRLDRNLKRLAKARALIDLAYSENDVADCDLDFISRKIRNAEEKIRDMRKCVVK